MPTPKTSEESSARLRPGSGESGPLMRESPAPVLAVTPDLRIVDVTDAFAASMGRERAELVGRHVSEVVGAGSREEGGASVGPGEARGEVVDAGELLERCMGDAGIARLLLEKFERQLGEDLATLARLERAGDWAGAARVAHGLSGAAGAVAAGGLIESAGRVERAARAGDVVGASREIDVLRAEARRCAGEMPRLIALMARGGG